MSRVPRWHLPGTFVAWQLAQLLPLGSYVWPERNWEKSSCEVLWVSLKIPSDWMLLLLKEQKAEGKSPLTIHMIVATINSLITQEKVIPIDSTVRVHLEVLQYNRGYSTGIWVGPTQRNPIPDIQDTKMQILLPCVRESAFILYPIQDWTKHYHIQNNRNIHKFAFHVSQWRHTKSAKIMWLRGRK